MYKFAAAALTLSALAMTTTAMAKDARTQSFKASLQYNLDAPAETTYERLREQSVDACKDQIRKVRSLAVRAHFMRSCTEELMNSAIEKVGSSSLSQYHAMQIGAERPIRLAKKADSQKSRLP